MKVVLDTNVLVSGLLSPFKAPGEIVRMTSAGLLQLCYDARVLTEYKNVLLRPHFGFNPNHVDDLLDQIKANGHSVVAEPLKKPLPDTSDEPFLEVALAAKAVCVVTGNLKDYPNASRQGMGVFSPFDFLAFYRTHQK